MVYKASLRRVVGFLGCIGLMVVSCSSRHGGTTNRLAVFVSIAPQKYFVERIAGEHADVAVLIPSGASPHSYEPRPSQMVALSRAALFFSVGVEMEKVWLPRIAATNGNLHVVATDSGSIKLPMSSDEHAVVEEQHGDHEHAVMDPHIWLSPERVKMQVHIITEALAEADTLHAAYFRSHAAAFEHEIDLLQIRIKSIVPSDTSRRAFLTFHPSWGYFADEFLLRQMTIEIEGKEPGMQALGKIIREAKQKNIRTVLVQPQFSQQTATVIAKSLGCSVTVADPLSPDWANNLLAVAEALNAHE